MASHASSPNDPRQPSAAKPYVPPVVSAQDLPIDYAGFIAVMCGVFGVMFRYKIGSWLAIIFCAQAFSNMKNFETDLKQVSMAMIDNTDLKRGFPVCIPVPVKFAVMGLVTNYFGPARPATKS